MNRMQGQIIVIMERSNLERLVITAKSESKHALMMMTIHVHLDCRGSAEITNQGT